MIKFPKLKEIQLAFGLFGSWEKIIFSFFSLVFIASLLSALWILNSRLSVEKPALGGVLREGIVGAPQLINPVLASSNLDRDLVALIYSGLMKPNGKGELVFDLAKSFSISEDGLEYTFVLKDGLKWHDGKTLRAEDVAFTITSLKNPELKSPLRANWEGVDVVVADAKTVKFILKRPYQPFIENTTLGILPKHILGDLPASQWRLSKFNLNPIGSGPYKIKNIIKDDSGIILSYNLQANKNYHLEGPYLKNLVLNIYPSETKLVEAFSKNEIDSFGGVSPSRIDKINLINEDIKAVSLPRIFALFFNQNKTMILADKAVRLALERSLDKNRIIKEVLAGYGETLEGPIPGRRTQKATDNGIEQAKEILRKAGFKMNEETGVLEKKISKKESIALNFSISTCDCEDLIKVAEILKETWSLVGAKIEIKIFEPGDLNQNVIRTRNYESLLFGEFIGRSPDLFPFWHSSARFDPGLNIALYANSKVDELLEKAREEYNRKKREELLMKIQEEIISDAPAIFLYSPEYIYVLPKSIQNFQTEEINIPSERFSNINKWYSTTQKVLKVFSK